MQKLQLNDEILNCLLRLHDILSLTFSSLRMILENSPHENLNLLIIIVQSPAIKTSKKIK